MSDARIEAILDVLGPRDLRDGRRLYIFEWGHEMTPTDEEVVGLAKKILAAIDAAVPPHLQVGDILGRETSWGTNEPTTYDGFCGGEFGRDSYTLKRVTEIAADYVVCRNERGEVEFYSGHPDDLVKYVLPKSAAIGFGF